MIKYIKEEDSTSSELIKFDTEKLSVNTIKNTTTLIDWMWIVDEDGEMNGTAVSKGDIIFSIYLQGGKRKMIIVKDEGLTAFYNELIEIRKKEYEERKACCDCECGSVCCSDCCC